MSQSKGLSRARLTTLQLTPQAIHVRRSTLHFQALRLHAVASPSYMATTIAVSQVLPKYRLHIGLCIDDYPAYTCAEMADDYAITVDQLQRWNTSIGSACDTGLYANLTYIDERTVCIAVNGSAPTSTAGTGPASVSSTAAMGPTQTGIVANCAQYYTVRSGDPCAKIDAMYNITFQTFYGWNSAGKSFFHLHCTHILTRCDRSG